MGFRQLNNPEEQQKNREHVQSLARGLTVIQAFGPERPSLTLSEVAVHTGLTRAAARRFLHTLEDLGFVKSDGKRFSLLPKVLSLGYAYLSSMCWWQVAQPFLEDVAKEVQESCSATVLDGTEVVYVARVPTTRIMTINLSIGSRLPAHCTSMGRVMLSYLSKDALDQYMENSDRIRLTDNTVVDEKSLRVLLLETKDQGFSLVDQELELGVRSLAVPIFDRTGSCIAAMNIGCHAARATEESLMTQSLPVLKDASRKITQALEM